MQRGADLPERARRSGPDRPVVDAVDIPRGYGAWAWVGSAVLLCAWSWVAGRDLGWDVLSHHLYIPFAWLNGRVGGDLHGAGPQLYQNPLGYLPFYAAVVAGWPSWLVGLWLALLHAVNGLMVWQLCQALWRGTPERRRLVWSILATLAALLAPVFLQVAGTSYSDPLVAVLVLLSLWLALSAPQVAQARRRQLLAGIAMGLAFAVKPSAVVFVVGLGSMVVWQWWRRRIGRRDVLACVAGGTASIGLGMGWHAWYLWRQFGNPVFPLFNGLFRSPYAPTDSLEMARFLPQGGMDWLARPFEMALPSPYIYVELFAPDVRVGVAVVLGVLLVLRWSVQRSGLWRPRGPSRWTPLDTELLVFALAGYAAWQLTSGNGRYALPLLLLAGLLAVRWAWMLLGEQGGRAAAVSMLVAQAGIFWLVGDRRVAAEPWDDGPYYPVKMDPALQLQPALHLLLGMQTHASLLVGAHRGGAHANPVGQLSLPVDDTPLGRRFVTLLDHWDGRTRVLLPATPDTATSDEIEARRNHAQARLYRLRLRIDWGDCRPVIFESTRYPARFVSCAVRRGLESNPEWEHELRVAERVFHYIESRCPNIYGPRGVPADRWGDSWQRSYGNSGASVVVVRGLEGFALHARSPGSRRLGQTDELTNGGRVDCAPWSSRNPFMAGELDR